MHGPQCEMHIHTNGWISILFCYFLFVKWWKDIFHCKFCFFYFEYGKTTDSEWDRSMLVFLSTCHVVLLISAQKFTVHVSCKHFCYKFYICISITFMWSNLSMSSSFSSVAYCCWPVIWQTRTKQMASCLDCTALNMCNTFTPRRKYLFLLSCSVL